MKPATPKTELQPSTQLRKVVFGGSLILIIALSSLPALTVRAGDAKVVELIVDPQFAWGLRVEDRAKKEGVVTWNVGPPQKPVWHVFQGATKSCAGDAAFHTFPPGGFQYRDDYFWLAMHPQEPAADVVAGVNAFREFGGVPRPLGDPWPHFYLEQRISNPGGHLGEASPRIADIARVDFAVSIRLLYDRRHETTGYDATLHSAQFVFFLTIQNLNQQSPGYGDYFWLAIDLYDDRKPVSEFYSLRDPSWAKKKGTVKLIYQIGMKAFTDQIVGNGKWVDVHGNLLPHVIAGLNAAWASGFLPASKDAKDYHVSSTYLGWEIPGLNDAAMAVKGLRAAATLKGKGASVK